MKTEKQRVIDQQNQAIHNIYVQTTGMIICPTYRNIILSKSNGYSMIPVVGALTRKMSCKDGR